MGDVRVTPMQEFLEMMARQKAGSESESESDTDEEENTSDDDLGDGSPKPSDAFDNPLSTINAPPRPEMGAQSSFDPDVSREMELLE